MTGRDGTGLLTHNSLRLSSCICMLLCLITAAFATADSGTHQSGYAGEEKRSIKSLSADDIQQLEEGKGWGLAKVAELNGLPGPAHVLEMKNQISLNPEQEEQIRVLFEGMQSRAIPLGKELIDLEKNLNDAFANHTITDSQLHQMLESISKVRMKLRFVHLQTHLETPDILTTEQVETYNRLRGYVAEDPCRNIPQGHNVEMWKKHNACD